MILVDLRSQRGLESALYSGSHVLPTSPEHLKDLLPWLPPETSVVLCGPTDLCNALLPELRDSSGSAAIYILGIGRSAGSQRLRILAVCLAFVFGTSVAFSQSPKSAPYLFEFLHRKPGAFLKHRPECESALRVAGQRRIWKEWV